ncbi:MAG: hypothetical protein HY754_06030 [Nitrospirae bacterium]|nr:hypothetical protein [Nitrospirota bacterium]
MFLVLFYLLTFITNGFSADINPSLVDKDCMICHANEGHISFKDGDRLSVKVDAGGIKKSVHKTVTCQDCHSGFSKDEHPTSVFRNKKDFTIKKSEGCRRCHFDKFTRTLEGIHYNILMKGNMKAPVCTDCHGSHIVYSGRKEKLMNARKCEKCHSEIYRQYSQSIHEGALIKENITDVPICSDCHRAHDITDPRTGDFHKIVPILCSKCHTDKDIMKKYNLSTAVADTYLHKVHRSKKFRNDADKTGQPLVVCTDCHGIHNIIKAGSQKPNIKANLLKRCLNCHPDMKADFPDNWISHYNPDIKKARSIYWIKPAVIIIIILFIGWLILRRWRYTAKK